MAIVAAFDRKVTREFFLNVAFNAVNFSEGIRRAEVLDNVSRCLADGSLSTTALKNTIEQFIATAEQFRKEVASAAKLLAEMPQNGETIS